MQHDSSTVHTLHAPRACPNSTKAKSEATYQDRVKQWLLYTFGPDVLSNLPGRNHRLLEESIELAQACGCSEEEAHELVTHVFSRPVGEKHQEVGGVMLALAALCAAHKLDMQQDGEVELARVWTVIEQVRRKPKLSPTPGGEGTIGRAIFAGLAGVLGARSTP